MKTPNQELIELLEFKAKQHNLDPNERSYYILEAFKYILEDFKEKEKQFAFNCWKEGRTSVFRIRRKSFEAFYSQFEGK